MSISLTLPSTFSRRHRRRELPHAQDRPVSTDSSQKIQNIEISRNILMGLSNDIRLSEKPPAKRTARLLAREALILSRSDAAPFLIATTLSFALANLSAAELSNTRHKRQIQKLTRRALNAAYPPKDSKSNRAEINDHLAAINNTSREIDFPQALEQQRILQGRSTETIIQETTQPTAISSGDTNTIASDPLEPGNYKL